MFVYKWYHEISRGLRVQRTHASANFDFIAGMGVSEDTKKSVLLTGGTNGLGKAVAGILLCLGHNLVLPRRTEKEGEVQELIEYANGFKEVYKWETNHEIKPSQIKFLFCDFSDLHTIEALIKNLKENRLKFDLLINNAGVLIFPKTETKQNFGMTLGVNYFGTFLLTERLHASNLLNDNSRIVNISSEDARNSPNLDEFEYNYTPVAFGDDYGTGAASEAQLKYAQSKLAITTYSYYLDKIKDESMIRKVIDVCPGPIGSNIVQNAVSGSNSRILGYFANIVDKFLKAVFPTPETAARAIVKLGLSDELEDEVHYHMGEAREPVDFCKSQEKQKWLVAQTKSILALRGFSL